MISPLSILVHFFMIDPYFELFELLYEPDG